MNDTRRRWVKAFIAVCFGWAALTRRARADPHEETDLRGWVRAPEVMRRSGIKVKIAGRQHVACFVEENGYYHVQVPPRQSDPYMVALIDAQRNTPILMVHHLTSGVAQQLSITVPVDGFQAVYSKLEAIEAIISYALVVEDKLARDLREQWPFDQVQHDVGLIKDDLANQVKEGKADARQVAYLQAKAEFILSRLTA